MFTGIVEPRGTVGECGRRRRAAARSPSSAGAPGRRAAVGDSMAVNGVCLTVVEVGGPALSVEAVDETLARSNLGDLRAGSPGEPGAARCGPTAASTGTSSRGTSTAWARCAPSPARGHRSGCGWTRPGMLRRYLVEKGSVAVDGVSLTVSGVDADGFEVVLIPHTLEVTTVRGTGPGRRLNLEVDVIAKYVERLLEARAMTFSPIPDAVAAVTRGEFVVVVDDADRENEGDLIIAARADHARADRLHGAAHVGPDLCADGRGAPRRAPPPAHGGRRTPTRIGPPSRCRWTTSQGPPPASRPPTGRPP